MAPTGSSEPARSSPDRPVLEGLSPTDDSRQCDTQPFSVSQMLETATSGRQAVLPRSGHCPSCSTLAYASHFFLKRRKSFVFSLKQHFHLWINHM